MAVPHLSHFMGLASPQMSTPTAMRGPCSWGDEAGVPAVNGATGLVASCWLIPKLSTHITHTPGSYVQDCHCYVGLEFTGLRLACRFSWFARSFPHGSLPYKKIEKTLSCSSHRHDQCEVIYMKDKLRTMQTIACVLSYLVTVAKNGTNWPLYG